jgi:hypothetical protein
MPQRGETRNWRGKLSTIGEVKPEELLPMEEGMSKNFEKKWLTLSGNCIKPNRSAPWESTLTSRSSLLKEKPLGSRPSVYCVSKRPKVLLPERRFQRR